MAVYGTRYIRVAGDAPACAPCMLQGAVLLEAGAGQFRTALRASPDAALAYIACVLLDWLAPSQHTRYEGQMLPNMRDAALAHCLWTGPNAQLGMQDTLAYALRHYGTLYLFYGGVCVTMNAHGGVDTAGIRDRVEVVGNKYGMDTGGFDAPPYAPTPVKLEDRRLGAHHVGVCCGDSM